MKIVISAKPSGRHFERCARNPEASMLDAYITCSDPSPGISFGLAQDRLSRGSHARE